MAKAATRLTAVRARALIAKGDPARHADGGNLYLHVTGPGRALWCFRFMRQGKAREMGLGVADPEGRSGLALAEARERAAEAMRCLREASTRLRSAGRPRRRLRGGARHLVPSARWPSSTSAHMRPGGAARPTGSSGAPR